MFFLAFQLMARRPATDEGASGMRNPPRPLGLRACRSSTPKLLRKILRILNPNFGSWTHFASPLRLLGSKGLGGMREAKTIWTGWFLFAG